MSALFVRFFCKSTLIAAATAALTLASAAQTHTAPSVAQIGSQNTVTADPAVPRPSTTPCVVNLFSGVEFADFSGKQFTYTPPADCPGPWAKVVLEGDFNITAGRQFDRTANIWIGDVNVYFGTTPEPSATVARSWHVESDLTDYSALFTVPQTGQTDLGNLVNSTYTGIIYGNAELEFYPLPKHHQPLRTADIVLPLSAGPGAAALGNSTSELAQTFTLPTNIERAYLDVVSQSQSSDEFWYTCVPNDVAGELESCGSTAFRETEVSIDGVPAGVAPVYPWIYTGGIDPYLWRPIPGIETLNFTPYRVDLTPFAGLLNDGNPHKIAISVFNAHSYFSATAALLLYLDEGSNRVTGAVTENTIGAPNPSVAENLSTASDGTVTGTVTVTSSRKFQVAGYAKTSHGKVQTNISQSIDFSSVQTFDVNAGSATGLPDIQGIQQKTTISSLTNRVGGGPPEEDFAHAEYPLDLNYSLTANPDGSFGQATNISQKLTRGELDTIAGWPIRFSYLSETDTPADTLFFDSSFNVIGHQNQSSTQNYFYVDSTGTCYSRSISASGGALTTASNGPGC